MTSNGCNSRHFSWLSRSCFPDPRHHHNQNNLHLLRPLSATTSNPTTLSSVPEDLLLDFLSRIPPSSLPSVYLVCRHWSQLLDSPAFHQLRRLNGRLHLSLFVLSFSNSTFFLASHRLGHDTSWKITNSFLPYDVVSPSLLSHPRLASIGRIVYVIVKSTLLRCDTWTGSLTLRPGMLVPRKKFATAVVAGKIYVAGGASQTSSAMEEYDPETDTWSVVSHSPRIRYGCVGAAVDGVFYVIGGLKVCSSNQLASRAANVPGAHVYASSMDLYDVEARVWLRSRVVPGGGCVVAACAAGDYLYVLASHAVELSFWRFNGNRKHNNARGGGGGSGGGFGDWCRKKSPPMPAQVRLDSTVRFSCVGIGEDKVVLIQVMGCIDDLLRRSGRSTRGLKDALVLVYDSLTEEWSRGPDLPEIIQRAAGVCVEC